MPLSSSSFIAIFNLASLSFLLCSSLTKLLCIHYH